MLKPFNYKGTYVCYPMITIVEENVLIKNKKLQEICLFDLAEASIGLGQINLRKTSSFCEKGNFINGINYNKKEMQKFRKNIKTYNYNNMSDINIKLIKNNFKPGIHICCAIEYFIGKKGEHIYVSVGVGIPKDKKNATLFMECVGKNKNITDEKIIKDMIKSIEIIGKNQNIEYEKIYIAQKHKIIKKQLGCAMVIIPYFLKE